MKRIHAIALTAAAAALFSLSSNIAIAQTVSGADPYNQGYAAGASAKQDNNFEAFDKGFVAGKAQIDAQRGSASAEAYDKGYEAGLARANRDQRQAFNQGYEARGRQDQRVMGRAYDNGYDAGASRRAHGDLDFP